MGAAGSRGMRVRLMFDRTRIASQCGHCRRGFSFRPRPLLAASKERTANGQQRSKGSSGGSKKHFSVHGSVVTHRSTVQQKKKPRQFASVPEASELGGHPFPLATEKTIHSTLAQMSWQQGERAPERSRASTVDRPRPAHLKRLTDLWLAFPCWLVPTKLHNVP